MTCQEHGHLCRCIAEQRKNCTYFNDIRPKLLVETFCEVVMGQKHACFHNVYNVEDTLIYRKHNEISNLIRKYGGWDC